MAVNVARPALSASPSSTRQALSSTTRMRKVRNGPQKEFSKSGQINSIISGDGQHGSGTESKNSSAKLPPLQISEKALDFGVVQPGAQIVKSLTICNVGQHTLRFGWKLSPLADLPSVSKIQATNAAIRATASSSPTSLTNYAVRLRSRTAHKKFVISNCGSLATSANIWDGAHHLNVRLRNATHQKQSTKNGLPQRPPAIPSTLLDTAAKPHEVIKQEIINGSYANVGLLPTDDSNKRNLPFPGPSELFSSAEKLYYLLSTNTTPSIQTLLSRRQLFSTGQQPQRLNQRTPPPIQSSNTAAKLPPTSARNSVVAEVGEESKKVSPENLWLAFAQQAPQRLDSTAASPQPNYAAYPFMNLAAFSVLSSTEKQSRQQQLDIDQQQQLEDLLGEDQTLAFLNSTRAEDSLLESADADDGFVNKSTFASTRKSRNIASSNMLDCIVMRPVWGILQPTESMKISFCFTSSAEAFVHVAAVCVYETLEKFAHRTEYGRQLSAGKLLHNTNTTAAVVVENDVICNIKQHESAAGSSESEDTHIANAASAFVDRIVGASVVAVDGGDPESDSKSKPQKPAQKTSYAVINLSCIVQKPTFTVDPITLTVYRQPFDVVVERSVEITNGFLGVLPYEVFSALPLPPLNIANSSSILPGQLYVGQSRGLIEPKSCVQLTFYYLPGRPGVQVLQPWLRMGIADPVCLTLTVHAFFPNILLDLPRSMSSTSSLAGLRQQLVEQFGANSISIVEKNFCDLKEAELERLQAIEQYLIRIHADQQARNAFRNESQQPFGTSNNILAVHQQQQTPQIKKLKSRPLPLHAALFPDYLLDFDVLVPEEKIITKRIKIVNPLPAAVHYRRINSAATETPGAAAINLTIMEETVDSYTRLAPGTAHTLEVAFDPSKLAYGPNEKRVVFDVNHGPKFGLVIRARLEHSRLNLSAQKLVFGDVLCGQVKFMTVQLHNPSSVTCKWNIAYSRDDLIRNMKFLPLHLRKEEQRRWQRGRCYETRPSDGTLHANERVNIEFAFMPKDLQAYIQRWQLNIEYSPERPEIIARGRGVRSSLEISTPKLDFGVTLPHEEGCVREIVIGNPHKFPIEFFCVQYDEQSRTEERILSCLEEFQTQSKVLLPPRAPGKELPSELEANYENLQEQSTLPKLDAGGVAGNTTSGAPSTNGASTVAESADAASENSSTVPAAGGQHQHNISTGAAAANSAVSSSGASAADAAAAAAAARDSASSSTVPSSTAANSAGGFGALRGGGHGNALLHGGVYSGHGAHQQTQLKSLASIVPRSSSSERAGALDALRQWQELIRERLKQLIHTISNVEPSQPQQQQQQVGATRHGTPEVNALPSATTPPPAAGGFLSGLGDMINDATTVPLAQATRIPSAQENSASSNTERYMTPLEVVIQNYKRSLATKSQKTAKNASFYAVGIIIDGMTFTGKTLLAQNFSKYFNIPVIHVDRLIVEALRRPGASGVNQLVYEALTNLPVDEEELASAYAAANSDGGVMVSPSQHTAQQANNSPSTINPNVAGSGHGVAVQQQNKQHHHGSAGNAAAPVGGSFVAQQTGAAAGTAVGTSNSSAGAGTSHYQQSPAAASTTATTAGAATTKSGKSGKSGGGAGGKGGAAGAQAGGYVGNAVAVIDQQQQKPSSILDVFESKPFALTVQRNTNSVTADDIKLSSAAFAGGAQQHEAFMQFRTFALPVELLEAVIKMRLSRQDCKRGFVIEGLDSSFSQSRCTTLAAILGATGPRKRVFMFSLLRRADKVPRLLRRQSQRVRQFTEKHNEEEIHYVEQVSELDYEQSMTLVQRQAYDAKLLKIKRARAQQRREAAAKEQRRIEQLQEDAALAKAQQQALLAAGGGTAAEQEAAKTNAARSGRIGGFAVGVSGGKSMPADNANAAGQTAQMLNNFNNKKGRRDSLSTVRGDATSMVIPSTGIGSGGGTQSDNTGSGAPQPHHPVGQQSAAASGGKQQQQQQKQKSTAGAQQMPPGAVPADNAGQNQMYAEDVLSASASAPLDEQESRRILQDLNKQIPRFTRQSHEYLKSLKSIQKLLDHWDIRQGRFVDVLLQNELRVKALQRSMEEAALMPVSTKKQTHASDAKSIAGGASAAAGSTTPASGGISGPKTLGIAQPSRMHAAKPSGRSAGGDRGTYENAASVAGMVLGGNGVETMSEVNSSIQRHNELNEQLRKLIGVQHIIVDREWSLPSDYRLCDTEAFVLENIMPTRQTVEDETIERLNIPRPIAYNVMKKSSLHGELPRPLKEFKFVEEVITTEPVLAFAPPKGNSPGTWGDAHGSGGGTSGGILTGDNLNSLQAHPSSSARGTPVSGARSANTPQPSGDKNAKRNETFSTHPASNAQSNVSTKEKHKTAAADDDGGSTTSKKSGKRGAKNQQSIASGNQSQQLSATHQSAVTDGHGNTPSTSGTPTSLDGHDSGTNFGGDGSERGGDTVSQEIQEAAKKSRKQFVEVDKPRWIIGSRKKLKLKLLFQAEHDAQYSQLITLQVVDFPRCQHSIACQAICSMPKITIDPHVIFGADNYVRVGDDEEVQKKWIDSRQTFAFGPIQIAKPLDPKINVEPVVNLSQLPATHRHTMHIQNTSSSTCNIRFGFVSGRRDIFSISQTNMLTIPSHEEQTIEVYAHPRAIGFVEDVLLGLIRDNAIPMQYNISCQGAKPELMVVTKQIRFNTIPVRATDTQLLEVKNPSMLPIKYNIAGLEALGQDFAVPIRTGIVPPRSSALIKMLFIPPSDRAVSHPKKNVIVEATDVEGQLGLLLNETVQVFAESYDLVVDLSFPKANETGVDFGIVRIGEEVRAQMTLKNKSRYECRFEYIVPDPKYRKFFFVIPHEGVLQPGDKPVQVTLGARAVEPISLIDEVAIKVKLCDPNLSNNASMANNGSTTSTNGREMASIPVKVTLKAAWAQSRISPRDVNFTTCHPSTQQTQTILIENTGGIEFKFSLRKLDLNPGGDSISMSSEQYAAAAAAAAANRAAEASAATRGQKRTKSSANVLMSHFPSTVKGSTKAATIAEGDETKAGNGGGSSNGGLETQLSTETLPPSEQQQYPTTLMKPNLNPNTTRLSTKLSAAPSTFATRTSMAGGGGAAGGTMSTITGKAEKRADKNNDANASGGKIQSGPFSYSPAFGTVQAGQAVTITIDFFSEIEGVFNDWLALDITDRNPAVRAEEFRVGVHGEVSIATIAMDNYEQLFSGHLIILQSPQTPRALELMRRKLRKTNIYVRERNKFYYRHTQVGTRQVARYTIFNPSSMPCDVNVQIVGPKTTTPGGSRQQQQQQQQQVAAALQTGSGVQEGISVAPISVTTPTGPAAPPPVMPAMTKQQQKAAAAAAAAAELQQQQLQQNFHGTTLVPIVQDDFVIENPQFTVHPHSFEYLHLVFAPKAVHAYNAIIDIGIDNHNLITTVAGSANLPPTGPTGTMLGGGPASAANNKQPLSAAAAAALAIPPRVTAIRFEVHGDGTLPRITVSLPKQRDANGRALLTFGKQYVGGLQSLPLRLVNDSLLKCTVVIHALAYADIFRIRAVGACKRDTSFHNIVDSHLVAAPADADNDDTGSNDVAYSMASGDTNDNNCERTETLRCKKRSMLNIVLPREHLELAPQEELNLEVDFIPNAAGIYDDVIYVEVDGNPFSNIGIIAAGEAYGDTVIVENSRILPRMILP